MGKSRSTLESLLQFRNWEAGIDCNKCSLRVGSFEIAAWLSAISAGAIAKHLQKRLRLFAIRNADYALRARHDIQFARLLDIAAQQNQKFRRPHVRRWSLITQKKNVARQQRNYFFTGGLLTDARHAQKRAQRSGNGNSRIWW